MPSTQHNVKCTVLICATLKDVATILTGNLLSLKLYPEILHYFTYNTCSSLLICALACITCILMCVNWEVLYIQGLSGKQDDD